MTTKTLNNVVEQIKQEVIEWRRHLHQNPELSFQEEKTAQFIYDTLESFGNLELSRPTETSVMARLIGAKPGRYWPYGQISTPFLFKKRIRLNSLLKIQV